MAASESSRVSRLRRAAECEGNVFHKLRRPVLAGGMQVLFMLADDHNHSVGMWERLEDAEAHFAEK